MCSSMASRGGGGASPARSVATTSPSTSTLDRSIDRTSPSSMASPSPSQQRVSTTGPGEGNEDAHPRQRLCPLDATDGREDKEGTGNSRRNMVEVVFLHLIQTIFRCWKSTGKVLSVGVVSLYSSQVDAIKARRDKKYDTCDGFHVRAKSIDGFQGEEDDIIILSTLISNRNGVVRFQWHCLRFASIDTMVPNQHSSGFVWQPPTQWHFIGTPTMSCHRSDQRWNFLADQVKTVTKDYLPHAEAHSREEDLRALDEHYVGQGQGSGFPACISRISQLKRCPAGVYRR